MDLRSLMNTSDEGDREKRAAPHAQAPPPPPPAAQPPFAQQQQQQQQQAAQTPTTPAQGQTSYAFRESAYSHALQQASPGGTKPPPPGHEYPPTHPPSTGPSATYPPPGPPSQSQSQSPYNTPGPYPSGRPQQPPALQTQYSDPRSPGAGSMPAPSPYRQPPTPSGNNAAGGAGYPFPASAGPPGPEHAASPVQRHQYPPGGHYPPRDSYSHVSGTPTEAPPPPPPHHPGYPPHHPPPHHQQHMPQTPPVGTPGAGHPFAHQRSQSTHSTPTPTSAQSQTQHYGQPYPHGSPVASHQPAPGEYHRQPSQPPTPLGPPLSGGQRQSSAAPFAQPPSPYHQRMPSASSSHANQPHATPPPPHPASIQRMPSNPASYDPRASESHTRGSRSNSERDRSLSVSPKTRVPSIPGSIGGHPSAPSSVAPEPEPRPVQPHVANVMDVDQNRASTPSKRKLADRDLSPKELEKTDVRPPPGQVNGGPRPPSRSSTQPRPTKPQQPSTKKRTRYATPPVWAQTWNTRGSQRLNKANFEVQKRGPPAMMNGKHDGPKPERPTRQVSPEAARHAAGPRPSEAAHLAATPAEPPAPARPGAEDQLGPWEPCILGVKPYEEIPKAVADFLFIQVVNHPDAGEIFNRGVQFEIEAKLGTLIDKDTNARVEKFVSTECLLHDTGRLAFQSSMTQGQHKGMNEWLNEKVVLTNPNNPAGAKGRVPIHYKRRQEVDKFYELPSHMQDRLPGCVRAQISQKHSIKVRVTHDMRQEGAPVVNQIVKARIADLHLHLPGSPLDCRISVNLEAPWDGPTAELEQLAVGHESKYPDRNKDRLCYTQSHYQIDLTQVTQKVPGPNKSSHVNKEHELEIELNPNVTIDQGKRAMNGQPHRYAELVEGFVDNIRVLARTASDYV